MNKELELNMFYAILGVERGKPVEKPDSPSNRINYQCFARDNIFFYLRNHPGKHDTRDILYGSRLDITLQKCSAILKKLLDANVVERSCEERKTYFEISNSYIAKANIVVNEADAIEAIDSVLERLYVEFKINDIDFDADRVKNDKKALLKYLQHIAHLETNIYSLKERYTALAQDRKKTIMDGLEDYGKAAATLAEKPDVIRREIQRLTDLTSNPPSLTCDISIPRPEKPHHPEFSMVLPAAPCYAKPGFFNKKKVEVANAALKSKYDDQINQYNQAYQDYQLREAAYNQDLIAYNQAVSDCEKKEEALNQEAYKKNLKEYETQKANWTLQLEEQKEKLNAFSSSIESERDALLAESETHQRRKQIEYEIKYVVSTLRKTIETQKKLYSYGVIYGKYRNYVAISSFCDYLISGRCSTLAGSDGAYNIYEQEARADIVISKLDSIILSLDQIQQNQYFIYNELQTANAALGLINGQLLVSNLLQVVQIEKLDEIVTSTEQTAYNTLVGVYYAKKNAELTDALGFMMAL